MTHVKHSRKIGLFILVLSLMLVCLEALPLMASADQSEVTVGELREDAVTFIHGAFSAGEQLDAYTAWVLTKAGEDPGAARWTINGESLQGQILHLSDMLSDHNSLLAYIEATQNQDGSFGPYGNEMGTKAPLEALAAVAGDLPVDSEVANEASTAIVEAVDYFGDRYENGILQYAATGYGFDYRCVEALVLSGEDLTTTRWVYEGESLHDQVLAGVSDAVYNRETESTVDLAKHLSVLTAVYPESPQTDYLTQTLATRQNQDGGLGSSVYDHVLILSALGKAGKLDLIDVEAAHAYLLDHKQSHTDVFGQPAGWAWGSAWGGVFHEEPDLTAQVLRCLSYFPEAGEGSPEVDTTIENGLVYLQDVQDPDTAAIVAQWDSTFATAETLLALKHLGLSYGEYAGADSVWTQRSRTKTVAQCLLAVDAWEDDNRRDHLVNILSGRQIALGSGTGSFDNSVYSDMWAFMALGEALSPDELTTMVDKAYLLAKQDPVSGAWGEDLGGVFYPDLISTTQALRSLYCLPDAENDDEVRDAVNRALDYLKEQQQEDGAVCAPWDDPAVDNAEAVATLSVLGLDPMGGDWTVESGEERVHPVSYLMTATRNPDGSFGSFGNMFGVTQTLFALTYLDQDFSWLLPVSEDPGTVPPEPDLELVDVAVVGRGGELLYGPTALIIDEHNPWGRTALGALDATGLDYTAGANGFVTGIAGLANSGLNGWMYKVNDTVPAAPAHQKAVYDGDRVLWWYSDSPNSSGPDWSSLGEPVVPPLEEQVSPEQLETLTALKAVLDSLEGERPAGAIVVAGEPMDETDRSSLSEQLRRNLVNLSQPIPVVEGGLVTDELLEAGVWIMPGGLPRETGITVGELQPDLVADDMPLGRRLVSGVYAFGPEGLHMQDQALLFIRCVPDEGVSPDHLSLARWNPEQRSWEVLPALYDPGSGLLAVSINHFSRYAAFLPEQTGVEAEQIAWAEDVVRALIPRGLFTGRDQPLDLRLPVTRGEFSGWLVRTLGFASRSSESVVFTDVPVEHPWAPEIMAAAEIGLVRGYGDDTFRPERVLTRQDTAALLVRALELLEPEAGLAEPDTEIAFTDADRVSDWAKESMARAVELDLIRGYPGNRLGPLEECTRVQALAVLWRVAANNG